MSKLEKTYDPLSAFNTVSCLGSGYTFNDSFVLTFRKLITTRGLSFLYTIKASDATGVGFLSRIGSNVPFAVIGSRTLSIPF
jgi:hypothetical protein